MKVALKSDHFTARERQDLAAYNFMKTIFNQMRFYRGGLVVAWLLLIAVLPGGLVTVVAQSKSANVPTAENLMQEQALAKVSAFQAWVDNYVQASPAAKTGMQAEGVTLGQQRRAAMIDLIKANPAGALALAVPAIARAQLPVEVAAQLETRVSGIGNLSVFIFCPSPNSTSVPPMQRWVELNGQTYAAYVFGRRTEQTTKHNIPLHGIVLDGVMALAETPLRVLEAGESQTGAQDAAGYSTYAAGATTAPVVAEVGGTLYRFASAQHLAKAKTELEAGEAGLGANPVTSATQVLQSGGGSGNGANPPTAWTTGQKKVLIIRVDFSDLTGDPTYPGIVGTVPYVQGIADNEVAPFYATSSYGLTSLSNVVTTQLYRMPNTAESYATAGNNFGLHADARALAAADYDLAEYDRICVLFSFLGNLPGSFINYGGLAQLGGPFLWVNGEFDFRVYSHELGHTYGLWHAGLWQVTDGNPISPTGGIIEYGDDFDTMGANFANDLRTDFNPYYKNQLGWLGDSQVQTVNTDPATYRLYTFDSTNYVDAPNMPTLGLRIVKDNTKSYWVGLRHNWADNPFMENGVYVIWGYNQAGAGGGGGFMSGLLDFGTPGDDIFDSPLTIGTTFTDADLGISIRPANAGGIFPNRFVDIEINGGAPLVPTPRLLVTTNFLTGGNGNGVIDINECNSLFLVLTNVGTAGATHVQVTLSTPTPGVTFGTRNSAYPDLAVGQSGTNLVPFTMSTAPFFVCGTPITVNMQIKSDQITTTNTIILPTGLPGTPTRFDSTGPVIIQDNDPIGTNSIITVSNITSAITKVTVSLYLNHTFDADLLLELIAPDGTTVLLSDHNGGGGDNYGASCAPELFRTTFDDSAFSSITAGSPPFVGSFRPQEVLSTFIGRFGTNQVNGDWKLRVVDDVGLDIGILQCWSLFITAAECLDGGGTCPGADLALGMKDAPDPVFLGSNLVYTISITNFGPSEAKGVVVNQSLPGSVVFASATASQGSVSFAGGTVVGNIGTIPITGVATMTVTVTPTQPGIISSTANVNSNDPDPDSANNSATVLSQVNPPSADLTVGLLDAPDPALVGELLTYTVSVTNNGPTTASGVTVTNNLPLSVVVQSTGASQGTVVVNANVVVCNFGTLTNGGRATATINVIPTAQGLIVATATVRANQADSNNGNNTATANTAVGPAANLVLTLTDSPDPVVVQSNWTYTITVTNQGANVANGVQVNQALPAGVNVVSTSSSIGSVSVVGTDLTASVGTLAVGSGAVITVVVNAASTNVYTSTATVSSTEADPNPANNSASVTTTVAAPFVSIVAAGATLTAESFSPADGGIGIGETVTVQLRLRNAGNVGNTNLTATLLATGGVTLPSAAANYGQLTPGGLPVSRAFTFTASGTNGGTVTVTLQLQDNGNNLGTVTYIFTLPTVQTFANTNAITIPDIGSATPYPSSITVSGVSGLVGKITATLSNLNHTFPQDVDVLLVGPAGQKTLLMSGAGAPNLSGVNVTFDEGAASPVPQNGSIASSSYRPAAYAVSTNLPAPAPVNPYPTTMTVFNGLNANGVWSLYIADRATGDAGSVVGGWSLAVTVIAPVNQIVDLAVSGAATPNPAPLGDTLTCVFTVTNTGPNTATGVAFTNVVPVGAKLLSATSSQGVVNTNGNTVIGNLGDINAGSAATVTVLVQTLTSGGLSLPAYVAASENDLNPANNSVSVNASVIAPIADLSVSLTATNSVVVGSNLTFTVTVTNHGPQQALNVVVSDPLPAGLSFVSTSAASFTNSNGTILVNLGNLSTEGVATFTIVGNATMLGLRTNIVSVATASSDSTAANNTAAAIYTVATPAPSIVVASATLTAENLAPANATVDVGETVTVSFGLQNLGSANTANLVATLQGSGGVTSPSSAQNYGVIAAGGATVTRPFNFTATGANGGVVVATLQLQDGANNLGTATYTFSLPAITSFTNATTITIPGQGGASPYPATISVAGLTGLVSKVTVSLNGVSHAFPDDMDVLLVSPSGQKVVLMSDVGGGHAVTNLTLNFADGSAALSDVNTIFSGLYAPTDYESGDNFPSPAPNGTPATLLAAFKGGAPNGNWSLYVVDDSLGDAGSIAGGWTLQLTTVNPVNPVADLVLTITDTPDLIYVGGDLTYTIGVINNGPAIATGVTVTDTLPAGVSFVSTSASQGSSAFASGTVTANLGTLAVGAGATVTIQVSPSIGGNIGNTAAVAGAEIDLNLANNTAQAATTVQIPTAARLTNVVITNSQIQFTLTGEPTLSYVIQASTNLTTWVNVGTNTAAGNGTFTFTDSATLNQRFYRAVRLDP
jgi:uncharacterized repeat protein (TIGR01451 family)